MKHSKLLFSLIFIFSNSIYSQSSFNENSSTRILAGNPGLNIGGYAQIDFNKNLNDDDTHYNSKFDVHRFVTFLGYNFNEKTSFVAEVEMEHVVELYVEQAFLSHRLNENLTLNSGLMLIPMGIQNLYHEPPTFNGVERTNVDKYIVPTTWREIGIGLTGRINSYAINYELMLVNGFNGYSDGNASFSGSSGLRSGRQKGAESYMTNFDFAARINYYGQPGLSLALSTYIGNSESEEYNGLNLDNDLDVLSADSTIVGINMFGVDARYNTGSLTIKAQYVIANISNTEQYNTKSNTDLGKTLLGYYTELGYNFFNTKKTNEELIGFIRYENYNTHAEVDELILKNDKYNRTDLTFGIGWKLTKGAMLKFDYQILSNESEDNKTSRINFGTAIWF